MKKFLLTLGQLMKAPQTRSAALGLGGFGASGLGLYGLAKAYDAEYGPNGEKRDPDPAPKPAPKPTVENPLPYLDSPNADALLNSIDRNNVSAEAALKDLEDQILAGGNVSPKFLDSNYEYKPLNADDLSKSFTNPDIKDLMKAYQDAQGGLDEETKQALYTSLLTGGLGAGLGALLSSSRRGLGALAGGAVGGALPLLYKYYKDNYANK